MIAQTVHSPLFSVRSIVEIERYALRVAILDACQNHKLHETVVSL